MTDKDVHEDLPKDKTGISTKGEPMHFSVAAIIKKDGKHLLIDRVYKPFGYAGIAGHIDEDEEADIAIIREVEEETGLKVVSAKLLFDEEFDFDTCWREIHTHHWFVYEVEIEGELMKSNEEWRSIDWYTPEQMKDMKIQVAWEYVYKKLNII